MAKEKRGKQRRSSVVCLPWWSWAGCRGSSSKDNETCNKMRCLHFFKEVFAFTKCATIKYPLWHFLSLLLQKRPIFINIVFSFEWYCTFFFLRLLFDHLTLLLSVDGGYSSWGTWSMCNTSCGMGFQSRSRTCTNPAPKYRGRTCQQRRLGEARESRTCNTNVNCPGNKTIISISHGVLSERLETETCNVGSLMNKYNIRQVINC